MGRRCEFNNGGGFAFAVCAFCGVEHGLESLGHEAITLSAIAGVELDEWQKLDLVETMRVDSFGRWIYTTVCICISRQNGKGEILQAREFYGVVTLQERILHTAHEVATAKNAFERAEVVSKRSAINDYVENYRYANGEQQIELVGRSGLFYRARTNSAGRGLDDVNVIVYDEAQELTTAQLAASSSTTAVAEHQQKWLLGSGGMATSEVWHGLREDAMRACGGGTGRIVASFDHTLWIEYTAEVIEIIHDDDGDDGDGVGHLDITKPDREDPASKALANPAYPHRVSDEFLESERKLFKTDPAKYDREHLGAWDGRKRSGGRQSKVPAVAWAVLADEDSAICSGHVFAVSVGWEQLRASVVTVGRRSDGLLHSEVLEDGDGTEWLEVFLRAKIAKNRPAAVAYFAGGATREVKAMLVRVCEETHVDLVAVSTTDYAAACGALAQAVKDAKLRHLGAADRVTPRALKKATVRAVAKVKWVWEWETQEPVSVLEAITVGMWKAEQIPARVSAYEPVAAGEDGAGGVGGGSGGGVMMV